MKAYPPIPSLWFYKGDTAHTMLKVSAHTPKVITSTETRLPFFAILSIEQQIITWEYASQNLNDPTRRLSQLLHVSALLLHLKRQGPHRYAVLLNNSQKLYFKTNRHLLKTCWLAKIVVLKAWRKEVERVWPGNFVVEVKRVNTREEAYKAEIILYDKV